MNKRYLILPLLLVFGLLLASCSSNSDNPVTPSSTYGNVYVTSTPSGAQIWVDGVNSNKVTPDTILNLSTGNHTFMLKLTDYLNDTTTVSVVQGNQNLSRSLTSDKSITTFGPIQVWESADPSASDPSGIVLKTGQAVSIGASTFGPVDIYYESTGFVVQTAKGLHNNTGRNTSFFVGLNDTLTDGVQSPLATSNWATKVNDTQTKYFFLFDQDSHYSKMIITEMHPATVGDPGWVKVKWLYNNKPNDTRF
jgi:hypothetical protein